MKNSSMTPRQNLLSLYRRQGYEYAPASFSLCESQAKRFYQETGHDDYHDYFNFPMRPIAMLSNDNDVRQFNRYFGGGLKDGSVIDEWGVGYEKGSEAAFHMTRMRHPLQNAETVDDIVSYPWPHYFRNPSHDYDGQVRALHNKGLAAHGGYECTIWERAWYIRGMDNLMADMMEEDEKAVYLLDMVTQRACENAAHFAQAGVDILSLGDDIGTQRAALMSVDMYNEWLLPRLKKVIAAAKDINPDILVQYHSCGYIMPFIESLCEAGVDILNPVQPECMDFGEVHAMYGDRLSFNGTLGTQTTMPFGTPEDVHNVVVNNLDIAGNKGGLLVCPTHIIEPEVPWENIVAYIDSVNGYRV